MWVLKGFKQKNYSEESSAPGIGKKKGNMILQNDLFIKMRGMIHSTLLQVQAWNPIKRVILPT